MAVPEQTPYIEYSANGVSKKFSVPFQCLSKNTLIVSIDGVETLPQLWDFNSGEIIFITAPLNNSIVSIKRSTHLKREVSYNSFTNSMLPTVFNGDFDRIWHTLQEQSYKLGRYDFDYSYAVNTSNQALSDAATAQQRADDAYDLADTTNTEIRDIERGGTGADNAADARTNLELYSQSEVDALIATGGEGNVVGVAGGGTGATTVAEARTNLGVMSSTEVENAINSATPQSTETALGVAKIATTEIAQAGVNDTDFITALKLRNALNANGSAPIYACRAWVNFNGVGVVSVIASGNVSSVTDNGVGDYTLNFATPMSNANYSISSSSTESDGPPISASLRMSGTTPLLKSTSAVRVSTRSSFNSALLDINNISVQVFC